MNIQHKNDSNKGQFYVEIAGEILAEMTYVWAGEKKIIVDHTDVGDELRGKGVGKQLVDALVDFARKNELKIVPLCPFTKSVFQKFPEDYKDVW